MSSTKNHVAVINADEGRQSALAATIEAGGFKVSTYKSPVDVLKLVTTGNRPDVIITDLHHPDMNGWRFSATLRSNAMLQGIRVPVITTTPIHRSPEFCAMAAGLGIDAIVVIPCEPDVIYKAIQDTIGDPRAGEPLNIIAIDDDSTFLEFLTTGFALSGIKITATASSAEGIELLKANNPDVIIIDHKLADCQAKEIMPEIIASRKKTDAIIIVVTGISDPDIAIDYIKLGVDAYVMKPFTIAYLADMINKARRERRLLRVVELLEANMKSVFETERLLRDLYDNAPLGYHVVDTSGMILLMNATELKWLGYGEDEIIGKKSVFDIQTPLSALRGRQMFQKVLASDKPVHGELEFVRRDGTIMPVLIHTMPIRDKSGKTISCRTTVQDVSERRKLESQMQYAQKMEAITSLVEGIAHHFNNILTPILVNASYLSTEFPESTEEHDICEEIAGSARRGADLVKHINSLIHQENDNRESVNLKKLVNQTANILRNTFDSCIRISTAITTSNVTVHGNAGQIQQAILNICLNARDAMPEGGNLSITLAESSFPGKYESYLCIAVSDTGIGIPKELQSRIFEPFFTTKGLAKNAGLGLSTAYTTAKIHSGFIDVQSEPAKGSTFRLLLPMLPDGKTGAETEAKDPAVKEENPDQTSIEKQTAEDKTILIIDDEASLQNSLSFVLKHAGYRVLIAPNGMTGLEIIRKSLCPPAQQAPEPAPRVDLVILDLLLPDISGERVLEDIRAVSHNIPVIISTGCTTPTRLTNLMELDIGAVMIKPYDWNLLLREVHRVLKLVER